MYTRDYTQPMFSTPCLAVDPQCRAVFMAIIRLDIYSGYILYTHVIKKDLIPLYGRTHKSGRYTHDSYFKIKKTLFPVPV